MTLPTRNGNVVATRNPAKKPVWEMSRSEQEDESTVVFDFDELLEFAEGNIGPVFGPDFNIIDSYSRRVRLPAREYLLVSRVTRMNAVPNEFKVGASMVTEYDLPINGELSLGGDIPWAVLVESGQCDLMLISYMGIDFQCEGRRVYRLLDTTLTFFGVASEGETLVYDIKVKGFAKGGKGEISMFFFEYDCFCNGKLLIEMRNGAAGFFSDEELAAGKGVLYTLKELKQRKDDLQKTKQAQSSQNHPIKPFLLNPCHEKTNFNEQDMRNLVERNWDSVFGNKHTQGFNYRLTTPKMLMIDRITHLDPNGGVFGLGLLVGEKHLDPNDWYFPCHFVKDQVMAGSLVSDGCSQLLKVYLVWLGLMDLFTDFNFRPVEGQGNKVRCRGQISPHRGKLVYVMEIREIGFDSNNEPYAIADVDIIDVDYDKGQSFDWNTKEELLNKLEGYGRGDLSKKIVVDFKGIALKMTGNLKSNVNGSLENLDPKAADVSGCLITDPSPPTEVVWHPFYEQMKANKKYPKMTFLPSKFPPRQIAYIPFTKNKSQISKNSELDHILNEIDLNFVPGQFPLNFYNIVEFMCGHVSRCFGPEYAIYDVSRTSRSPAFDLALVTRVVNWTGLEPPANPNNTMGIDVNPSKGKMICEFDCPEDAWFFQPFNNSSESYSHLPYSVIMEIALQTSGLLTSILKAPLTMKKKDILFRNLDAKSEMMEAIKNIDLRGKTIINRSECQGYNMLGKMGIHKFKFELFVKENDSSLCNGNLDSYINNYERDQIDSNSLGCIYKGETSFGWFVPEVFETQVGLDSGKKRKPKFLTESESDLRSTIQSFKQMDTSAGKERFVEGDVNKQVLMRKTKQGEYLDEVNLGLEYAHGKKDVNVNDWFFSCHFWNDPVMPGSLGIESMYQLMEFYVMHNDLFKQLPQFANGSGNDKMAFRHCAGETSWKYRGQLTTKNKRMDSEVFIKSVEVKQDSVFGSVLEITADGNLYVDDLRVYETKNIRLQLTLPATTTQVSSSTKLQLNSSNTNKLSFASPSSSGSGSGELVEISAVELRNKLLDTTKLLNVGSSSEASSGIVESSSNSSGKLATIYPVTLRDLGDSSFMDFYGVTANLYSGAMAKGIASADLVIAMGQSNMLGSFGAGGLPMHLVEKSLKQIKQTLGEKPFAVNLIHSPFDPNLEEGAVKLFKQYGVNIVEASAFMNLTPSVVLYRASGLSLKNKEVIIGNKLIAKCSRTEVAAMFLQPPPVKMLDSLLKQGKISQQQHSLAQMIPMADDISVEADSGGHTDNRQMQVILPLVINLRNQLHGSKVSNPNKYSIATFSYNQSTQAMQKIHLQFPLRVRVGGGGGIGCPEAALCAYNLGAAFLVTGTINQMCKESGTCDVVRTYLSEAGYADVTMAPAADMFEQGVQLQVLKKGTMFPSRAKKLYDLFCKYNSFEDFPEVELRNLEKRILKKTLAEVWEETRDFYLNRIKNPEKIEKVEIHGDQKLKMSLCFRWYLGLSSFWANSGVVERKTDYQVWCGPAIGAFNEFIKGSWLDPKVARKFPSVVDANCEILKGAAFLERVNQLKYNSTAGLSQVARTVGNYKPSTN